MTDQGRKEAITKQVRMVRYREQSVRDCVDNIESMIEALKQGQTLPIDSVSGCPFEAYAVFCIECDRQGIKPIKHKDYLEMG
jgi:vacuolar-type H+-ATPase subunit B/Vma2